MKHRTRLETTTNAHILLTTDYQQRHLQTSLINGDSSSLVMYCLLFHVGYGWYAISYDTYIPWLNEGTHVSIGQFWSIDMKHAVLAWECPLFFSSSKNFMVPTSTWGPCVSVLTILTMIICEFNGFSARHHCLTGGYGFHVLHRWVVYRVWQLQGNEIN